MRILEVRRHSMRTKSGQHLFQAGVALARHLGDEIGPFDRVVTSTIPRAFETAIAMGFAVDEQCEQLSTMGDDVDAEIQRPASFAQVAQAIRQGGAAARFAQEQVELWRSLLVALPEGGRVLVVTHGGLVKAGAVACLPDADHSRWGPVCDYCEGVRLYFDGQQFTTAEILRMKHDDVS